MHKKIISLPEKKIVGLKVRTNNLAEMSLSTAKIGACTQKYFQEKIAEKNTNRTNAGTTLCIYTDYESDLTGDYSFFIGEEVSFFDSREEGLETHVIPAQTYTKFTTYPGPMPQVIIDAWQKIWKMSPEDFGGKRTYKSDLEIYDNRAKNLQKATVDICIGIELLT